METVTVDWTSVPVSRVALGCELLGGTDWGTVDEEAAVAAVRRAYDLGVTVFDTADAYGLGRSEEVLAAALGTNVSQVIVVTKGGIAWSQRQDGRAHTRRDLSPGYLRHAVHGSLRRLGLDQIPLYLAHWPDDRFPPDEVVASLADLQAEGLIRTFGLSNFSCAALSQPSIMQRIAAIEVEHSLLSPAASEIQIAARHQRLSLAYGVLGQGLLTGKYGPDFEFPVSDRRHRLGHFQATGDKIRDLITALRAAAHELRVTPGQVAIRWAMHASATTCVVVGARTPVQVDQNVAAVEPLPPPIHERLTLASARLGDD